MVDYYGALDYALTINEHANSGKKFAKAEAVKRLAAFGLFTDVEIAQIAGVNIMRVRDLVDTEEPPFNGNRMWTPWRVLPNLEILADYYHNDNKYINDVLIRGTVGRDCSVKALSELTGIPIEIVRDALR